MKRTALSLVTLTLFTGSASAASNINLYGKIEAAYQGSQSTLQPMCIQYAAPSIGSVAPNCNTNNHHFKQGSYGESRLGIKGTEDLGNGMAAFFQLESKINGDTGSISENEIFSEKSVVGINFSHGQHSIYFGRSASPIERIGFNMDHLSSGLDWKSSAKNWKNAAFYDYQSGGLSVMAAVTTKGGLSSNATEGMTGYKPAYGISAKYAGDRFTLAAAYQKDNDNCYCTPIHHEWGVGGQYTISPITVSASYADATRFNDTKQRKVHGTISAKLSSHDTLFVNFLRDRTHQDNVSSTMTHWGLGYVHALSKRTEIFVNAGQGKFVSYYQNNSHSYKNRAYDFGMRHSF